MAETKIEWAHYTFNPWRGCTKVSDGCKFCYADNLSTRNHDVLGVWGKNGTRPIAAESYWKLPLKWNKEAEAAGERRRVFCGSLMDIFEGNDTMPLSAYEDVMKARKRLFHLILYTPHLDWLLLTKRPENVNEIMFGAIGTLKGLEYFSSVWLGTSVEDQQTADTRIPHLLNTSAAVRFLSMEPLLDCVDISMWLGDLGGRRSGVIKGIDWVIVGGESGANARPMHPDWVRSIRDQCEAAKVPFFFKQWGDLAPWHQMPELIPEHPEWTTSESIQHLRADDCVHNNDPCPMYRVGKKKAGRLLDGREWNEFPEVKK